MFPCFMSFGSGHFSKKCSTKLFFSFSWVVGAIYLMRYTCCSFCHVPFLQPHNIDRWLDNPPCGCIVCWKIQVIFLPESSAIFGSRYFKKCCCTHAFWIEAPSLSPMLEVLSAVTGESIAVFEDEEIADASVKALKQRLARKIGLPRFRLQLLQDNCPLDNDQTFAMQVVQLVVLEFQPPDTEQDRGVMMACSQNDDKLLEQQLNTPRSPNFQDANHKTPLYVAASNGSLKCVLLLLEAGANKDQGKTDTGLTPLCIAAHRGHLEVVRFLVESGANKDQGLRDNGETPLCIAAHRGHLEVVRILVESGANKDQGRTDNGATPLFSAAHSGHLEVVQFLVESGANKNQGQTDTGATPLYIAAQNGHLEVVRFLVESGANKDQCKTDTGSTPVFIAAQKGHLEVVRFLVESGANKDQGRTDNGATPLFSAAHSGHLEVVRFLVESGANKDQGTTDNGETPLWIAAHRGHLEVVRFLGGARSQQAGYSRRTPGQIL